MHGSEWRETSRWNHALEEDLKEPLSKDKGKKANAWSRPHLPSISVPALFRLRQALRASNILLDVPGMSLDEVLFSVLSALIRSGDLTLEGALLARDALGRLHTQQNAAGQPSSTGATPLGTPALRASSSPMSPFAKVASPKRSPHDADSPQSPSCGPESAGDRFSRSRLAVAPPRSPRKSNDGPSSFVEPMAPLPPPVGPDDLEQALAAKADAKESEREHAEWFHMLEPDAGEEALDLLLAHVPFVEQQVMAFVRLQTAIDAGCEHHAPVRYLFLLLGPEQMAQESNHMAHALAAMMLDETFVMDIADCDAPAAFLSALDLHIGNIAILPHVHAPHQPGHEPKAGPAASSSEEGDDEGTSDEDEVVLAGLEAKIRARKGMGKRAHHARAQREKPDSEKQTRPVFSVSSDKLPIQGALDGAVDDRAAPPAEPRVFIELEQFGSDQKWDETHHWNWALGQELDATGGWTRPHLPTISARALIALYEGLGEHNILLDLPSIGTFADAARSMLSRLVDGGMLTGTQLESALSVIAARQPCTADGASQGAVQYVAPTVLSPDKDEEAFELLLAHVDFVTKPTMSFARFVEPIEIGCEGRLPAKFLFIMLSPVEQATESVQMATAFASMMLDEDLVHALRACSSTRSFLDIFSRALECVTIVPRSHLPSVPAAGNPGSASAARAPGALGHVGSEVSLVSNSDVQLAENSTEASGRVEIRHGRSRNASREASVHGGRSNPVSKGPSPTGERSHHGLVNYCQKDAPPTPTRAPSAMSTSMSRRRMSRMMTFKISSKFAKRNRGLATTTVNDEPCTLNWARAKVRNAVHKMQAYSLPLLAGILVALIWANADPDSYEYFVGADSHVPHWSPLGENTVVFDHKITVHFIVNDIFMVFFFGLAAKEVTEACLPGGSLNPPRKALSPLVGTVGGVAGPIIVYLLSTYIFFSLGAFSDYQSAAYINALEDQQTAASEGSSRRMLGASDSGSASGGLVNLSSIDPTFSYSELAVGWGVPTATDISLAWMVSAQVFPFQHPAIEFLLLLAVADDAIGLIIIAVAYGDPNHPAQPIWLLLVLGGVLIAVGLRKLRVNYWSIYVLTAGVASWIGLINAALHPALALAIVVPTFPSTSPPPGVGPLSVLRNAFRRSIPPSEIGLGDTTLPEVARNASIESSVGHSEHSVAVHHHDPKAALHAFERHIKLPVDLGMFFFTLSNAGVRLNNIGALTVSMLLALVLGKIIGITFLVLGAAKVRCAPLNGRIGAAQLSMISGMASIGLTVALFIAGEAFQQEKLQAEAKMGALLSGLMGLVCYGVSKTSWWRKTMPMKVAKGKATVGDGPADDDPDWYTQNEAEFDDVAYIVASTLERTLLLSRANALGPGGVRWQR